MRDAAAAARDASTDAGAGAPLAWGRLYTLVLIELALIIVLLTWLTRHFA